MKKLTHGELNNHLITILLIFAVAIILLLLFGLAIVLLPQFSAIGWDLLAFSGSIIGGLITYVGVKLTISAQRDDSSINNYHNDKAILYKIIQETHFIKNVNIMEVTEDNSGKPVTNSAKTLKFRLGRIVDFLSIMERYTLDLIKCMDDETFETIHTKVKFLTGSRHYFNNFMHYYYYKGETKMSSTVSEYIEKATEIQTDLEKYKEQRRAEYYELMKKVSKDKLRKHRAP